MSVAQHCNDPRISGLKCNQSACIKNESHDELLLARISDNCVGTRLRDKFVERFAVKTYIANRLINCFAQKVISNALACCTSEPRRHGDPFFRRCRLDDFGKVFFDRHTQLRDRHEEMLPKSDSGSSQSNGQPGVNLRRFVARLGFSMV